MKVFKIILFLLIALTSDTYITSEIIQTSYYERGYGEYAISVQIDDKSLELTINPSSPLTTATGTSGDSSNQITFEVNRRNHTHPIGKGTFKIEQVTSPPMYYAALTQRLSNSDISESLSFALKPIDESYSLIHQLYNAGKIDKKMFAVVPENTLKGQFYIGGIPNDIIANKSSGHCLAQNETWACTLETVRYKNEENKYIDIFDIKFFSFMHYGYGLIVAPLSQLKVLEERFFKKYLENQTCRRTHNYILAYECNNEDAYNNFPSELEFVFGDFSFSFPKAILLRHYTGSITVNIFPGRYAPQDIWIFGNIFLRNFISTFDFDSKTITLYRDEKLNVDLDDTIIIKQISFPSNNRSPTLTLIILLLCLSVFGLAINLTITIKDKLLLIE